MLSRFALGLGVQTRSFSFTQRFCDRFSRDQLRNRLFKQNVKEVSKTHPATPPPPPPPYHADTIPVRKAEDLMKALGFTIGITTVSFTVAAISDYERNKTRIKDIFESTQRFFAAARGVDTEMNVRTLTPGEKCAVALVALNCIVTILWRIPPLQPFMWRYFSNSFASRSLCWPMLLSTFSHSSLLHLGLNMYVLWSFTQVAIDKFFGPDHFWAFYLSAGVVSSLTSLAHKSAIRSPIRALGASGAILGLLTYTCCKIPDARLKIVFIPNFDFSAESAVIGMIVFDLVGLLFRFRLFDHAAHLGGALFGVGYALYGEELVWGPGKDAIVSAYRSITKSN